MTTATASFTLKTDSDGQPKEIWVSHDGDPMAFWESPDGEETAVLSAVGLDPAAWRLGPGEPGGPDSESVPVLPRELE